MMHCWRCCVWLCLLLQVRMVKMARVFKASRVLQRVILDYVMNQWEWTYAVLKMGKLLVRA